MRSGAPALGARVAAAVPADGLVGVLVPTDARSVRWRGWPALPRAGTFLPLDPHLPPARNQAIIAEAGLAAVIVPATTADGAAWLARRSPAHVRGGRARPAARTVIPRPAGGRRGDGAVHLGLHRAAEGDRAARALGPAPGDERPRRPAIFGPHDRLLSLHPPPTSAGARDILGALLSGASLHLVDLKRDGLAHALARLRGDGITICAAVPVVVRALLAMDGAAGAFRGLRIMRLSGDAVMGSDIAGTGAPAGADGPHPVSLRHDGGGRRCWSG